MYFTYKICYTYKLLMKESYVFKPCFVLFILFLNTVSQLKKKLWEVLKMKMYNEVSENQ